MQIQFSLFHPSDCIVLFGFLMRLSFPISLIAFRGASKNTDSVRLYTNAQYTQNTQQKNAITNTNSLSIEYAHIYWTGRTKTLCSMCHHILALNQACCDASSVFAEERIYVYIYVENEMSICIYAKEYIYIYIHICAGDFDYIERARRWSSYSVWTNKDMWMALWVDGCEFFQGPHSSKTIPYLLGPTLQTQRKNSNRPVVSVELRTQRECSEYPSKIRDKRV